MTKKKKLRAGELGKYFFLFIIPALAIYLIFSITPFLYTIYFSFTDYTDMNPVNLHFVGLKNYIKVFEQCGITVLVSDRQVLDICYNKLNMNQFLSENDFSVPKTYTNIEAFKIDYLRERITFPIICKPTFGSGGKNTFVINNMESLEVNFKENMLIQ